MRCLLLTRRSSAVEPWIWSPRKTRSARPFVISGISESCLRNWMNRDAVDSGRKPGLTTDEHKELVELRRRLRCWRRRTRSFSAPAPTFPGERAPKMGVPAGPGAPGPHELGLEGAARVGDVRVDRGLIQPHRRHTSLGDLSPADYEALHPAAEIAA